MIIRSSGDHPRYFDTSGGYTYGVEWLGGNSYAVVVDAGENRTVLGEYCGEKRAYNELFSLIEALHGGKSSVYMMPLEPPRYGL